MSDFRKYACEISGVLFKQAHKKGIRRERLARELDVSVNQIKNYAYDSTKAATLENFLNVMITYRCEKPLEMVASEMGYAVFPLPETGGRKQTAQAACDAMEQASAAVKSVFSGEASAREEIMKAIEKLLILEKSL